MSDDSERRGKGKGRRPDAPSFRPPPRPVKGRVEEDIDDEATWAAAGSPYSHREHTAEVTFFDEAGENTTSVDWNPGSSPSSAVSYDEEAFQMNLMPRGAAPPTDQPTEPGPGSFASSPAAGPSRGARGAAAGLALPSPRTRAPEGVRPIPPVRRAGQHAEGSGRYEAARPVPVVRPSYGGAPGRGGNLAGILIPVGLASVAMLALAALVSRAVQGTDEAEIAAPMLPVVGVTALKTVPPPPFDLVPPAPFRPDLLGSSIAPEDLPTRMAEALGAENLVLATALSDRAVRIDIQPARFFAHGRLLADVGEIDAALYWLVRAVQERGVPPSVFVEDRAFRWLWIDERWDAFIRWVVVTSRYYSTRGPTASTILTPDPALALEREAGRSKVPAEQLAKAKEGLKLPVLIWLDDIGGSGGAALGWGQELADQVGVLVIGVGGPDRIGPTAGMWSGDPARDLAQITDALTNIPGFQADPKRRYLVGVGQGAQYAVELMLRDPDFALGALALGPSDTWKGTRDAAAEGKARTNQTVRIDAGALDPSTHTLARVDRGRLMRASIPTDLRIDAETWPDGVPPDIGERVITWLAESLDPKPELSKPPEATADATLGETPPAGPGTTPAPEAPAAVPAGVPAEAATAP